jgi:hypothetical protein
MAPISLNASYLIRSENASASHGMGHNACLCRPSCAINTNISIWLGHLLALPSASARR